MTEIVIDLRDGGDWSLDLCFAGLRKVLGVENVLDVPWKKKHREWAGVVQGFTEPDWGLERRTLGYLPNDDLQGTLRTLDPRTVHRVWLDERLESFRKYQELGLYESKVPVVVVAGHDRFWNKSPSFVASLYGERLQAMLLDNWYPEYTNLPFRTRRIGWSCNFDHYWDRPTSLPEKDIDICFIGYNSHPDRARFIEHIKKRWGHLRNHIYLERRPDTFEEFIPKSQLFGIMQRSKICLNLRGAADRGKTLRAYEIIHVGSYMLSQKIDDPGMYEDFPEGICCDYFSDESQLDELIDYRLNDDVGSEYRETIAVFGHNASKMDLSVEGRWRSVVQWIDSDR